MSSSWHATVIFLITILLLDITNCETDEFAPSEFKSVPTTVKTFEKDTVLLPCYLENAGIGYHVRWLKDGKLMVDSSDHSILAPDRVRLFANHSIQVRGLVPSDTGKYVCENERIGICTLGRCRPGLVGVCSYMHKEHTSPNLGEHHFNVVRAEPWAPIQQVHAIEVLHPPSVVGIPEIGIVEVRLGDEVDIACKASGTPQPAITWLSKGEPMELLDYRQRLKFKATNRHLAGNYECIATNGVGEPARASIQVIIMHPPEVVSETPWVHTTLGHRAQLECQVVASPHAKVHWFRGPAPVLMNSRIVSHVVNDKHILVFRTVRPEDLGVYTCKAENRIGMAETRMHLSGVANIAIFKSDPTKNHPTPTSFSLIWEVDSYSPIIEYNLWFRPYKPKPPQKEGVFMKEKDDTWTKMTIPGENTDGPMHTASYVLKGLTPSTVYEAQITSRNRFGWSKPSAILHFATSSGVMDETRSTDESNHLPVLEDDYTESEQRKNATELLATIILGSMETNNLSPAAQNNAVNNLISSMVVVMMCIFYFSQLRTKFS